MDSLATNNILHHGGVQLTVMSDDVPSPSNCSNTALLPFSQDFDMKRPHKNEKCHHKYCEFWGDRIMCTDCKPARHIREETFPSVFRREMAWKIKLGDEDHSHPDEKVNRAVTIQFLLDFCNHYNLWDVSTRDVRRDYVVPMTSEKRCRFVDLQSMIENNIVGPSSIFISHTWSGKFGDIVAAVRV